MEQDSSRYEDIINLPRHVSAKRQPMSRQDRAAQFSPFAALTGYDAVIRETERLTEEPAQLSEGRIEALNAQLCRLLEVVQTQPEVTVTYFRFDERKAGGMYVTAAGRVKKIDSLEKYMLLTDGTVIDLEQIYSISSPLF